MVQISPLIKQCLLCGTTLLAGLSAGASTVFPSVLLFQLKKDDSPIKLNLDSASWIGSVSGLAAIPSICMPNFIQWRGRKFTFITSSVIFLVGWIIIYSSQNVSTILIGECFLGFGASSLLVSSDFYLTEISTPRYRNVFLQSYNMFQGLGVAITSTMINGVTWKNASLILGAPVTLAIVIAFFWPESPYWLALKGEVDKCTTIFLNIRGKDENSLRELNVLLATQKDRRSRVEDKISFIKSICNRLFYVPALHILLLCSLFYFCGCLAIIIYSAEIIKNTSADENLALTGVVIMNCMLLSGQLICSILTRYFNNKTVLLWSAGGVFFSLLTASLVTYLQILGILDKSPLCLYCLIAYMLSGSMGVFPLTCSIAAELMPVKFRGIGGGVPLLCNCILTSLTLKSAPYLFVYIGMHGTFFLYSLTALILPFFIWRFVPETKGKSLQEIEHFYKHETDDEHNTLARNVLLPRNI